MPSLDLKFTAQAIQAQIKGQDPGRAFSGVSTDSRSIEPGQLFLALKGPSFDGHDYVQMAFAKGASAAVVEEGFAQSNQDLPCLLAVPDTLKALGDLARAWRLAHQVILAAVTGSNGKTTTKEMLASILSQGYTVLKNQGNKNNLIGLPQTLLTLSAKHSAVVSEMGMNMPGEIARLTEIAEPQAGLVTNVGPAHLGPMGSMEAIAGAKAELYEGLGSGATAVVNLDDPLLSPWAKKLSCRVVTFGLSEKADLWASDLSAMGSRQAFTLTLPGEEAIRPRLAVPGGHNVMNALAASAAAWALGMAPFQIKAGLEGFAPVPGRLTVVKGATGPWLLDDTYNANPASVAAGLGALADIAAGRRMGLILGDMLELGPQSPELHRQCGADAVRAGCQVVLSLGEQAGQVRQGALEAGADPALALAFEQREELIEAANGIFSDKDVVLIKGSRGMAMEKVVAGVRGPEGDWY